MAGARLREGNFVPEEEACMTIDLRKIVPNTKGSFYCRSFVEDNDGMIWIGTNMGLFRYSAFNNTTIRIDPEMTENKEEWNADILMLSADSDGNIWIATNGSGLFRLDVDRNEVIKFSTFHGLPDNVIYSIAEDKKGNVWMGTNGGLCCFDPETVTARNFTPKDGIQNYEYNRHSVCRLQDGQLAFGGIAGFNVFHPDSMVANASPPGMLFTDFKVFNTTYPYEHDSIFLNYDQNSISFEFTALSFFRCEYNQYAYRLSGVDRDWVYAGNRRYVSYSNLRPGKYTFQVKACNSDQVWNEVGLTGVIVIEGP
ncbi:MAG: hypothetical protein JNM00_02790, partial [Flavobacteriales bacterium]|nr:hypothetical protein [Flavobacteriales bacterium]